MCICSERYHTSISSTFTSFLAPFYNRDFGLPPSAPRSFSVGSVFDVSAFKLTGSPSCVGFFCASCFNDGLLRSTLAPVSSGVGCEFEVSALRDTWSPSWVGLRSAFCLRVCGRWRGECVSFDGDKLTGGQCREVCVPEEPLLLGRSVMKVYIIVIRAEQ